MPDFYRESSERTLLLLDSCLNGLAREEAARRWREHGPNTLERTSRVTVWGLILDQFKSFITYILLFAIGFSLLIGEFLDSLIILAIVLLNGIIGFFQEWSANRSLEALRRMTEVQARVRRDGESIQVAAQALVPGDIILLREGERVPADARILEAKHLQVEESALTGESLPVAKQTAPMAHEATLADRDNMLFTSTSVVQGHATAVVTATGMSTELGRIARLVSEADTTLTPLQQRLEVFGHRLGVAIIGICLFIFAVSLIKASLGGEVTAALFLDFALIAISLAVAAVPTALPAVVTIALSVGVKRLLRRKALVRRLSSVETLGSCDVICTDKTGTLTTNQMTVRYAWTPDAEGALSGQGYSPSGAISVPIRPLLFRIGAACNDAQLKQGDDGSWSVAGDPTEGALLTSALKAGITPEGLREDELPFDALRKRMSVVVRDSPAAGGGRLLFTKGAPDHVLAICSDWLDESGTHPLDAAMRNKILAQNDRYAGQAMRVLGFAYRALAEQAPPTEERMIFVGLQAMLDPPRPEVPDALARCKGAGIRVVMITGDHKETARAVGEEIGITGNLLTGAEIERMSDAALDAALAGGVNLFSRVVPEHKLRIVAALQRLGCTVAMTGDGVNDAPALKQADIGVAVGSGTDVAKEAADFVLLDDSFASIVDAIEEGRGIYDNIQKSIMLLLSGNLGEVLIIFLAVILDLNLPLTAVLLLWINMVTDGAPALAYSVDPYAPDIMERKPKPRHEAILPFPHLALITLLGSAGTLIALALFRLFGGASADPAEIMLAQTMVFNFVVVYEMILVFAIRISYGVPARSNGWIWATVVASLGLQGGLIYSPLSGAFKIVPLSGLQLLTLAGAGALFFGLFLVYRKLFQQRLFPARLELLSSPSSPDPSGVSGVSRHST